MSNYKVLNNWKPITHLVSAGLSNSDCLLWKLQFNRYCDETRKEIHAMPIGELTHEGFVPNKNWKDKSFKMIFSSKGHMMFFEQDNSKETNS